MRRAVLGALALLLAACSSSGGGLHASTGPGGLPPHPTSGPKADRVFLAAVRPDFPASVNDSTLVGVAHAMCKDFDAGRVDWTQELAAVIKVGGIPAKAAGGLIAASVATYCPQNVSLLPGH